MKIKRKTTDVLVLLRFSFLLSYYNTEWLSNFSVENFFSQYDRHNSIGYIYEGKVYGHSRHFYVTSSAYSSQLDFRFGNYTDHILLKLAKNFAFISPGKREWGNSKIMKTNCSISTPLYKSEERNIEKLLDATRALGGPNCRLLGRTGVPSIARPPFI